MDPIKREKKPFIKRRLIYDNEMENGEDASTTVTTAASTTTPTCPTCRLQNSRDNLSGKVKLASKNNQGVYTLALIKFNNQVTCVQFNAWVFNKTCSCTSKAKTCTYLKQWPNSCLAEIWTSAHTTSCDCTLFEEAFFLNLISFQQNMVIQFNAKPNPHDYLSGVKGKV